MKFRIDRDKLGSWKLAIELERKFIALRRQQWQIFLEHGSPLFEEARERWKAIDTQLDQLRNDHFEWLTAVERKYRGIRESTPEE